MTDVTWYPPWRPGKEHALDLMRMNTWEYRAKRHADRADAWMKLGRPDYAAGSMRKVMRARAAGRRFDMMLHGALPYSRMDAILRGHIDRLAQVLSDEFEHQFLTGIGDPGELIGLQAALQ